ncbi:MAG: HPP family protein [Sulfurimonas sp.]|nr:HPP family protein [Sulfurimonas sp.]
MFDKFMIYIKRMNGFEKSPPRKPFSKILWSWLGAFLGIYIISILNDSIHSNVIDKIFLIGSFGASAVLIYGAPQVEFSQPRNVLGGHVLSALVGVTVYKFLPFDPSVLSAIAVSTAIVAMHFTGTLHPPGGATSLIAVIGSSQIHEAGYTFVFLPVALDAFVMLLVALIVNNLSKNPKRHYPRYWF